MNIQLIVIMLYLCQMEQNRGIKNISSVQLLSRVRLFATPWIAVLQASLSLKCVKVGFVAQEWHNDPGMMESAAVSAL